MEGAVSVEFTQTPAAVKFKFEFDSNRAGR
jgi:hypothetical protein